MNIRSLLTAYCHVLLSCLVLSTLVWAYPSSAAVVIQYHHISDETPAATSISPALFKQHMDYLAEHKFAVVPLPHLIKLLQAGKPLPDNTVAITFDDGYLSVYHQAFPILKKHGWPFTVFVNSHPIEQGLEPFVTWEQLREMAAHDATIGNHSWSHPHFVRRLENESDNAWRSRITAEIERTERELTTKVKQRHRLLAYPYGEFDIATKKLVKELGFAAFGQQSGPLSALDDLQALPRFPFGGIYGDINDFATKVQSLPMPLAGESITFDEEGQALSDTILPQQVQRPQLRFTLTDNMLGKRVRCFASGQGAIGVRVDGSSVIAQATKDLPAGRSRYNCTAPSDKNGHYYWYSRFFIKKQANGNWYTE